MFSYFQYDVQYGSHKPYVASEYLKVDAVIEKAVFSF